MSTLEDLVTRYREELRRWRAERRELDARIAAREEVIADLEAALGSGETAPGRSRRRGRITQAEAVRRVLSAPGAEMTAAEIYVAALEAGAAGSERSLRNVLSRKVKDGELTVDRRSYPRRYRLDEKAVRPSADGEAPPEHATLDA